MFFSSTSNSTMVPVTIFQICYYLCVIAKLNVSAYIVFLSNKISTPVTKLLYCSQTVTAPLVITNIVDTALLKPDCKLFPQTTLSSSLL